MIQKNSFYPKFEAGQVLSSNLLNNSIGYVEEQGRLTRSNLIGTGIMNGLDYTYSNGKLTINPGTAITADGFIVQFAEKRSFTCCSKEVSKISGKLPLDDTDELSRNFNFLKGNISHVLYTDQNEANDNEINSVTALPENISGYLVALVVDFPKSSHVSCNQVTCNAKYIQTNVVVRPVLIPINLLKRPFKKIHPIETSYHLAKLQNFSGTRNLNILSQKTKDLYYMNSLVVKNAINSVLSIFLENPAIDGWNKATVDWKQILPEYKDIYEKLKNCRNKYGQKISQSTELPQYFLLHLEDMCEAINEFITFYNEFSGKYRFIKTSQQFFDRIVIINKQGETNPKQLEFLYRFQSAQRDKNYEWDCEILKKLLVRIYKLSACFIEYSYQQLKDEISFEWKNPNAPMGENPIPFYYHKIDIKPYWVAHTVANPDKPIREITYPSENDILMFQNCYGKNVFTVLNKLNEFLRNSHATNQVGATLSLKKKHLKKEFYDFLIRLYEDKTYNNIQKQIAILQNDKTTKQIVAKKRKNNNMMVFVSTCKTNHFRVTKFLNNSNDSTIFMYKGQKLLVRQYSGALQYKDGDVKTVNTLTKQMLKNKSAFYISIIKVAKALGLYNTDVQFRNRFKAAVQNAYLSKEIPSTDVSMILSSLYGITQDEFIRFYEFISSVLGENDKITSPNGIYKYHRKYAAFHSFKAYLNYCNIASWASKWTYSGCTSKSAKYLLYSKKNSSNRFLIEISY